MEDNNLNDHVRFVFELLDALLKPGEYLSNLYLWFDEDDFCSWSFLFLFCQYDRHDVLKEVGLGQWAFFRAV